jgi:thiamine kinase-like enzyme
MDLLMPSLSIFSPSRIKNKSKIAKYQDSINTLTSILKRELKLAYTQDAISLTFKDSLVEYHDLINFILGSGYYLQYVTKIDVEFIKKSLSGSALYKVIFDNNPHYIIRIINNEIGEERLDNEILTSKAVGENGLGAEVITFYKATQYTILVLSFLNGTTISACINKDNKSILIQKVVNTLYPFHHSELIPLARDSLIQQISTAYDLIIRHNIPCPAYLHTIYPRINVFYNLIKNPQLPCHYDLNLDNILLVNNQIKIIDWELSCIGSYFIDLAIFFMHMYIPDQELIKFLKVYCDSDNNLQLSLKKLLIAKDIVLFAQAIFCFCQPFYNIDPPHNPSAQDKTLFDRKSLEEEFISNDLPLYSYLLDSLSEKSEPPPLKYHTMQYKGLIFLKQVKINTKDVYQGTRKICP